MGVLLVVVYWPLVGLSSGLLCGWLFNRGVGSRWQPWMWGLFWGLLIGLIDVLTARGLHMHGYPPGLWIWSDGGQSGLLVGLYSFVSCWLCFDFVTRKLAPAILQKKVPQALP